MCVFVTLYVHVHVPLLHCVYIRCLYCSRPYVYWIDTCNVASITDVIEMMMKVACTLIGNKVCCTNVKLTKLEKNRHELLMTMKLWDIAGVIY